MKYFQFIHSWKLYEQLPMKHKSILPDEGFGWRYADLTGHTHMFYITCLPKGDGHNARHRIYATCKCGREVPFGRLGQHRKACAALQWYTERKENA